MTGSSIGSVYVSVDLCMPVWPDKGWIMMG